MNNSYKKRQLPSGDAGTGDDRRVKACPALEESNGNDSSDHDNNTKESASALIISASDKAGMSGIDRERIDAIILRESGNSKYMQQQRKRDQQANERIAQLRKRVKEEERRNPKWRTPLQKTVDDEVNEIISQRPVRSACVVVDMDMFFMACELLHADKSYADKPCCVGGGMITTSNYKARRYGVRAAMAGYIGDKLVEELSGGKEKLIHFKSNFQLYKEKSSVVMEVLKEYDPNVKACSLDEAFLDLAPYFALKITKNWNHQQILDALLKQQSTQETVAAHAPKSEFDVTLSEGIAVLSSYSDSSCLKVASVVVNEMRQRVFQATGGLTCSAGVAPNFLLAKIASDRNKPNGQCLVRADHQSVIDFLHPLPTRKVNGIGRVSEKTLLAFNIKTCRDLYNERALVRFLFKPATAAFLLRASVGCSSSGDRSSDEENGHGQKGISRERTFQSGHSWTEINSRLEDIARLLSDDMERKDIWARTITVKVKLDSFDVFSRARSMSRGVFLQHSDDLSSHAAELLREIRHESKSANFSVRLLGIRCSNFRGDEDPTQQNLDKFFSIPQSPVSTSGIPSRPASISSTSKQPSSSDEKTSPKERMSQDKPVRKISSLKPARSKPLECPICQRSFDKGWLLSRHVEVCLSGTHQSTSKPFFTQTGESTVTSNNSSAPRREVASSLNEDATKRSIQKSPALAMVNCPVCQKSFPQNQNDMLNKHIDSCLSGRAVRRAIQDQSKRVYDDPPREIGKKSRITDFW